MPATGSGKSRNRGRQVWSLTSISTDEIEMDTRLQQRVNSILTGCPCGQPAPPWNLHEDKGYNEMSAAELMDRRSRSL